MTTLVAYRYFFPPPGVSFLQPIRCEDFENFDLGRGRGGFYFGKRSYSLAVIVEGSTMSTGSERGGTGRPLVQKVIIWQRGEVFGPPWRISDVRSGECG